MTLAMILAGGRVGELNALTYYRPKSAVPFGGFGRVIDFALSNLMNSGIERVAILSQYRSYSLINHLGTGAAWDMTGRYRRISILPPFQGSDETDWYRGSADAVFKNLDFVKYQKPERILILSGDHIYRMNYQDLIDYHQMKDADVTFACIKVEAQEAHRFGVAAIDDEDGEIGGKVSDYWEKPEQPQSNWASLTVLCFKPDVLYRVLKENQHEGSFEFGRDIIPKMIGDGLRVYGYKFSGYWGYTRTVEEYWRSSMDMLGDNPDIDLEKWGFRTNLDHLGIRDFQPLITGEECSVANSLIYNGCTVEGTVKNSILFPGVHVGKGAIVENSVVFFNNIIGKGCRLNKVVSDVNNNYGAESSVGGRSGCMPGRVTVVGWDNAVPAGYRIEEGAMIYPGIGEGNWPDIVKEGEVIR